MIIREAIITDAAGIAKVHVDAWRSTYAGIVPDNYLGALSYEQKTKRHIEWLEKPVPGTKTFVAVEEAHQNIVGFAEGGHERSKHYIFKGELNAIYILEGYQRRGIGSLLLNEVVKHLRGLGIVNMITRALADNPYAGFYEKAGGTRVGEETIELGGKQLKEIVFGWQDLSIFFINFSSNHR